MEILSLFTDKVKFAYKVTQLFGNDKLGHLGKAIKVKLFNTSFKIKIRLGSSPVSFTSSVTLGK